MRRAIVQLSFVVVVVLLTGCTATTGFELNGAYPSTPGRPGIWWGSWTDAGDGQTGSVTTPSFVLGNTLEIPLAGYPGKAGNRLYLSDPSGNIYELPSPDCGEKWEVRRFQIPSEWRGRSVRLVAEDARVEHQGWFAFQPPVAAPLDAIFAPLRRHFVGLALLLGAFFLLLRARVANLFIDWLRADRERAFLFVAIVALTLHWLVISAFAVDVPIMDEWSAVIGRTPGEIRWKWLIAFHNEHRIVFTRLMTEALYHVSGLNFAFQTSLNYLIYIGLLVCVYRYAAEQLAIKLGPIAILGASTIAHENHEWAFQSQFHFVLLFFVAGIWLISRGGNWMWLGALSAVCCMFSFSTGVIFAMVCAIYCAASVVAEGKARRVSAWGPAIAIVAFIPIWFDGMHRPGNHPAFASPFALPLWNHFFNVLSAGFGYREVSPVPGIVLLSVLICLVVVSMKRKWNTPARLKWVGVTLLCLGVLGGIGTISIARAGFGVDQAKSPRYAEISFLLVPLFWIFTHGTVAEVSDKLRCLCVAVVAIALVVPFYNDFSLRDVYSSGPYQGRNEARQCIQRYYMGQGDGTCPTTFPVNLSGFLETAKAANISFTRTMVFK